MKTIFSKIVALFASVAAFLMEDKAAKMGINVKSAGVINRGILGGFRGKVANVIGGSWKGIAYMRSQPLSVANPNTAAQQSQRTAFSDTVAIAQEVLSAVIKPLMDRFAGAMSGFNYFVQQNIGEWVTAGVFTWENLRFSIGTLTSAEITSLSLANGNPTVGVNWSDNSGTGTAAASDQAYAVVYNATQNVWRYQDDTVDRQAENIVVTFAANLVTADVVHAWLMFKNEAGDKVSNTTYATDNV